LGFQDGSIGTLHYFANGHASFPKERLEIFCANRVLQLENFRRMNGFGWSGFRRMNLWRQDKGQRGQLDRFLHAVRTGSPMPLQLDSLVATTRATLAVGSSLSSGRPVIW